MLSIADVPLMLEDPEGKILAFYEKFLNPEEYRPWLRRSWPGPSLSQLAWPTGFREERPFKLNTFYWPCWGASRWAYGHFFADAEQTEAICKKAFGEDGTEQNKVRFLMSTNVEPTIQVNNEEQPEEGEEVPPEQVAEKVDTQLYLLPPYPISAVPIDDKNHEINNLFLLTVVDARYYWWNCPTPGLSLEKPSTWEQCFGIIEGSLKIDIDRDDIDSAYLSPSPQLFLDYVPIPPWIDTVCFSIGHRFVARLDGTYLTQDYQSALTARVDDIKDHPDRLLAAGGEKFKDKIR